MRTHVTQDPYSGRHLAIVIDEDDNMEVVGFAGTRMGARVIAVEEAERRDLCSQQSS